MWELIMESYFDRIDQDHWNELAYERELEEQELKKINDESIKRLISL